ncbi:hypothetical protein IMY05_C4635000200 [Salix suchowensis]|nr:hypothetical protein IMY05_C4635000200 [Salix suchowensis]
MITLRTSPKGYAGAHLPRRLTVRRTPSKRAAKTTKPLPPPSPPPPSHRLAKRACANRGENHPPPQQGDRKVLKEETAVGFPPSALGVSERLGGQPGFRSGPGRGEAPEQPESLSDLRLDLAVDLINISCNINNFKRNRQSSVIVSHVGHISNNAGTAGGVSSRNPFASAVAVASPSTPAQLHRKAPIRPLASREHTPRHHRRLPFPPAQLHRKAQYAVHPRAHALAITVASPSPPTQPKPAMVHPWEIHRKAPIRPLASREHTLSPSLSPPPSPPAQPKPGMAHPWCDGSQSGSWHRGER